MERFVWQNPDQGRTNQNVQIYLKTTLQSPCHIIKEFIPFNIRFICLISLIFLNIMYVTLAPWVIIERPLDGEPLFVRGAYWKKGAKSNYYGTLVHLSLPLSTDDGWRA